MVVAEQARHWNMYDVMRSLLTSVCPNMMSIRPVLCTASLVSRKPGLLLNNGPKNCEINRVLHCPPASFILLQFGHDIPTNTASLNLGL